MTAARCHCLSFWVVLSLVSSSSSHACTYRLNTYSKEYLFWNFLSVDLSLSSLSSVLRTLATLVPSMSQFYLLNSGLSPGFPSCTIVINYLKAMHWGNYRINFDFFPSHTDHCPFCLITSVLNIIWFFVFVFYLLIF